MVTDSLLRDLRLKPGKTSRRDCSYETFRLPAGVYESLRIVIGTGEGHNWWCVVFPSLCIPATSSGFADIAVGAGFDSSLTAALEGQAGYEIRFYLLDQLGRLENIFFQE